MRIECWACERTTRADVLEDVQGCCPHCESLMFIPKTPREQYRAIRRGLHGEDSISQMLTIAESEGFGDLVWIIQQWRKTKESNHQLIRVFANSLAKTEPDMPVDPKEIQNRWA